MSDEMYAAVIPPEPAGLQIVTDRDGDVWQRHPGRYHTDTKWVCPRAKFQGFVAGSNSTTWRHLVYSFGPITAVKWSTQPCGRGMCADLEGHEGPAMSDDYDEQVQAFDRHTTDMLARGNGEVPLFHLSLPLDVDLMHAINRGVSRELGRMGYRVLIGEGGRVFAKPKPAIVDRVLGAEQYGEVKPHLDPHVK